MHEKDNLASLIAFLFDQDRKAHPPPGDLLDKILHEIKQKDSRSSET